MCKRLVYLKQSLRDMTLDDHIPSKKLLTKRDWGVIELVHNFLKPFKSFMIVLEGKNYVNVSFIPTVIKSIRTKLREVINSPVLPGPETSVKNLVTRLIKDFRLRCLGDK